MRIEEDIKGLDYDFTGQTKYLTLLAGPKWMGCYKSDLKYLRKMTLIKYLGDDIAIGVFDDTLEKGFSGEIVHLWRRFTWKAEGGILEYYNSLKKPL